MRKITLYIGVLFILAAAGCATSTPEVAEPAASPPGMSLFENARGLEASGNYEKAYVAYSEALTELDDVALYQEAIIARARTLHLMNRHGAALSALSPMPEFPETLFDCRKMVLAAKILQRMDSPSEYVEALLEVALDTELNENGVLLFKAEGYAELGKVYIAGNKVDRAMRCFEYAAELYEKYGDMGKMRTCLNIRDYLK